MDRINPLFNRPDNIRPSMSGLRPNFLPDIRYETGNVTGCRIFNQKSNQYLEVHLINGPRHRPDLDIVTETEIKHIDRNTLKVKGKTLKYFVSLSICRH